MAAAKGNSYATKARIWTEAIKRAMREEFGSDWEKALTAAAKPLIQALKNGDMAAIKEVGDRLEGKPHQTSEVTVNRVTSLEELPTHELERIAFGSRQGTTEETGGPEEHSAVH